MAKFVPDIKTQRWIVIAPSRSDRPDEHNGAPISNVCVFCPGNENLTPPEIMRIGKGERDSIGWKIRVVPNKFPITDIHEVIIHSPEHKKDIEDFTIDHVVSLLYIYRARFQFHALSGQVMIFTNHGEHAGASLKHPHSQLVVIPKQINLDALVREPVMNMVEDNNYFVTYCPDFSQWPYEVWIAPKKEGTVFADITDEEIKDLAVILQRALKKLKVKYGQPETKKIHYDAPFAYNFYIHHAKNWFIRIIPRLVHRAGFELGTGLSVNVVDPTIAARELREIEI
jgi:UDPglucose--hexose-1-phosphate uridylyltransferase